MDGADGTRTSIRPIAYSVLHAWPCCRHEIRGTGSAAPCSRPCQRPRDYVVGTGDWHVGRRRPVHGGPPSSPMFDHSSMGTLPGSAALERMDRHSCIGILSRRTSGRGRATYTGGLATWLFSYREDTIRNKKCPREVGGKSKQTVHFPTQRQTICGRRQAWESVPTRPRPSHQGVAIVLCG